MATPYSVGERVHRKLRKSIKQRLNPNNEGDGDEQRLRTLSAKDRIVPKKTGIYNPSGRYKMKEAIEFIAKFHDQDISEAINSITDKKGLADLARRMMAINLGGWKQQDDKLVFGEGALSVSAANWNLHKAGTISPKSGRQISNDWLYNLSVLAEQEDNTKTATADKPDNADTDKDVKLFGVNFARAGSILNTLDSNGVMNYLQDAVRGEHNTEEAERMRRIWETTGINWRFEDAKIQQGDIILIIKVKYSTDGTQEGVKERTLSIRVQPTPEANLS